MLCHLRLEETRLNCSVRVNQEESWPCQLQLVICSVPTLNPYFSYHTIQQLQPLCLIETSALSLIVPLYTSQSVMP